MASTDKQPSALETLCQAAIKKHLGDISNLPDELAALIRHTYTEFITAYLNLWRQRENKAADWFPQNWSVDFELADGMRHFFSDYQHIAKKFFTLNRQLDRLDQIDRKRQPNLYQHAIDEMLGSSNRATEMGG